MIVFRSQFAPSGANLAAGSGGRHYEVVYLEISGGRKTSVCRRKLLICFAAKSALLLRNR